MDKALQRSARYLAISGVAAIVFGVIVLVWPGISLVALVALFGAFAFVYGALAVAGGLNLLAHKRTDWVPFVLGGLVGMAIGAVTFFKPGITVVAEGRLGGDGVFHATTLLAKCPSRFSTQPYTS